MITTYPHNKYTEMFAFMLYNEKIPHETYIKNGNLHIKISYKNEEKWIKIKKEIDEEFYKNATQ